MHALPLDELSVRMLAEEARARLHAVADHPGA